jgi:hypothetical protein
VKLAEFSDDAYMGGESDTSSHQGSLGKAMFVNNGWAQSDLQVFTDEKMHMSALLRFKFLANVV